MGARGARGGCVHRTGEAGRDNFRRNFPTLCDMLVMTSRFSEGKEKDPCGARKLMMCWMTSRTR